MTKDTDLTPTPQKYFELTTSAYFGALTPGLSRIIVHDQDRKSPALSIIRSVATYSDGDTKIKDEIKLRGHEERPLLSARLNTNGRIIDCAPKVVGPLFNKAIEAIKAAAEQEGSTIVVENTPRFVVLDGVWEPVSETVRKMKEPEEKPAKGFSNLIRRFLSARR